MRSHIELNNEVTQRGEDGFFQLYKDKEAIEAFKQEVDDMMVKFPTIMGRIHWLVQNNYYYDVLDDYTVWQVQDLHELAYDYGFEFQSYMAISKFYRDYAMKTNDKQSYLEHYEDRVCIASLYLAQGDYEKAKRFMCIMMEQRNQPATPTFLNAGKTRGGEHVSCFLTAMDDSLNSINYVNSLAGQLSKIGGGVSIGLDRLRGNGETIQEVEGAARGVVPVMKILEDIFSYVDQLGQRPGAGAVYLNVFHWDIEQFLATKGVRNVDEKVRIKTLSMGVTIPSKFMELARKDEKFYMFAPHSVFKEYGEHLHEMNLDEMYDKLLANPNVKKKEGDPRELLNVMAQMQIESGYPYLFFKDNANKVHPLKNIGQILQSNLC